MRLFYFLPPRLRATCPIREWLAHTRTLPLLIAISVACCTASAIAAESANRTSAVTESGNRLPRVASINLCADQLLLEFAEPSQILSLTNLSHERAASIHVDKAIHYPVNTGIVEEILPLQPDIVLAGAYTSSYTLKLLRTTGLRVEIVPIANSMSELIAALEMVAGWLQQEAKATPVIAAMKHSLATLPMPSEPLPRAAIYDPRGYTVGRSSLRGEMLELAGWRNVAAEKGIQSYGTLALETVLKLDPDVLIESPYSTGTWSRAQALNSHPALRLRGLQASVITIPSSQTICGGPWSMDVIAKLLEARQALSQQTQ